MPSWTLEMRRTLAAAFTCIAILLSSMHAGADEEKGRMTQDLTVGSTHDVQLKRGEVVQVLKHSGQSVVIMAPSSDGSSGIYQIDSGAVEMLPPSAVAIAAPATTNAAPVTSVTTAAAAPSISKTSAAAPVPAHSQPQAVSASSNSAGQQTGLASELNGHLVTLKDGQIENLDASSLQGVKYWAVYFSASWCPDCVPVTPELVRFYKEFKADHPNFELIMVCHDKTQDAMHAYMKKDEMPWPALRFQDVWNQKLWPLHYIAKGIPNLILIDSDGKVLSKTYDGTVDHGTDKVMDDIRTLVPAPAAPSL